MAKIKGKAAKLEKNFTHTDNRKKNKVTRSDNRDYLGWFHRQGFECLECGTKANIEAHHVHPQDNTTVVPFCSYCHRGDNKDNAYVVDDAKGNAPFCVSKGYYLHRGTRSADFKKVWPNSRLLLIAKELHSKYQGGENV